jgi:CRISPR-associated protein Csd1
MAVTGTSGSRSASGVEGAQSSGAALVSFNLDAFTSCGKEQGDNAPASEAGAFPYGAARNRMLDRSSRNRLPHPVGDATVVYWADASGVGENAAKAAEDIWAAWFNPRADDAEKLNEDEGEAAKLESERRRAALGLFRAAGVPRRPLAAPPGTFQSASP